MTTVDLDHVPSLLRFRMFSYSGNDSTNFLSGASTLLGNELSVG